MAALQELVAGIVNGGVRLVDLTQPLSDSTPTIGLPAPWANTPGWRTHEISRYDERGPDWYWNWFEGGEHVGTHFDAPIHWRSGRGSEDVASVPIRRLVAPAVVVDRSAEVAEDPDFLLSRSDLDRFQDEHGAFPHDSWLLYRTGWDVRAADPVAFRNADASGSHTPGVDPNCARWIAEESPFLGLGVETIGTDAGQAGKLDPPHPCHLLLHGAGKYGLSQLTNLDRLPPLGALLIVLPLKLVGGSGSPCRAVALVDAGT